MIGVMYLLYWGMQSVPHGNVKRVGTASTRYGIALRHRRKEVGFPRQEDLSLASKRLEGQNPKLFEGFSRGWVSKMERDGSGMVMDNGHHRRLRTLSYLLRWSREEFRANVGVEIGEVPLQGSLFLLPGDKAHAERRVKVYRSVSDTSNWRDEEVVAVFGLPARDVPQQTAGVEITDDRMSPYLDAYETAFVELGSTPRPGDKVAVYEPGEGRVVRLLKHREGERLMLEMLNPSPNEQRRYLAPRGTKLLGRVVWRKKVG